MKTYKEMADSVFERIRENEKNAKVRKTRIKKTSLISVIALLAVSLLGFGAWKLSSKTETGIDRTEISKSETSKTEQTETTQQTLPSLNIDCDLQIQSIESAPSGVYCMFALMTDDGVRMDKDQLNAYYGINVFPTIPYGMKEKKAVYEIYKRKADGTIYWDQNKITYENEDQSKWICLDVAKDNLPYQFCELFSKETEKLSTINGEKVYIAHADSGEYYTEFIYRNVGFRMAAYNVDEELFISVIASLFNQQ